MKLAISRNKLLHLWTSKRRFLSTNLQQIDDEVLLGKINAESSLSLDSLANKKGFLIDMDGVIYHQSQLLPGNSYEIIFVTMSISNYYYDLDVFTIKCFSINLNYCLYAGSKQFVQWLKNENKKFLFLTNGSILAPRELQQKLARMGIEVNNIISNLMSKCPCQVEADNFYTSALATAQFLSRQKVLFISFLIVHLYAVAFFGLFNNFVNSI